MDISMDICPKKVLTNIPAMGQNASKTYQNQLKNTHYFCSFQTHMDRHGVFSTALCREFRRGSFYNPPKPGFLGKHMFCLGLQFLPGKNRRRPPSSEATYLLGLACLACLALAWPGLSLSLACLA